MIPINVGLSEHHNEIHSRIILIFGIILIVVSCLFFAIAGIQIMPWGVMDFPCDPTFTDPIFSKELNIQPTSRLAYCISYFSWNASGGGVYAMGASDRDEVQEGEISLKRQGDVLYVNGHPIQPNGSIEFVQRNSSYNPWLIYTTRYSITNEGLTSLGPAQSGNLLYVSGAVQEGLATQSTRFNHFDRRSLYINIWEKGA